MTEKVLRYLQKFHMLDSNDNVVAGVSGGADSVCLLRVLAALREKLDFALTVVHVDHRIRPEASEDAAYVEALCKAWKVDFVLVEKDVEAIAQQEHISCEEAGRKVRYEAFEAALRDMQRMHGGGQGCIAVAHNSDDRAETLLFHLFRGTGLKGMASIRPVRKMQSGTRLIRPLLGCTRDEIEDFLKKEGIDWRTDATNAQDLYTRNRIRNHILPAASDMVCDRAREHLAQEAQLLMDTSDFVERMTKQALERCCVQKENGWSIDVSLFQKEDAFLQDQILYSLLLAAGTGKDLTAAHVAQVGRLLELSCQSGRKIEIPVCQIRAERQFDQVLIMPYQTQMQAPAPGEEKRSVFLQEGLQNVAGIGQVEAAVFDMPCQDWKTEADWETFSKNIPEKAYTKWFDYDKILESVMFRTRQQGDFLTIDPCGSKKPLKRFFMEQKIPAALRDRIVFLADGPHVIWIPGYRISAFYKVSPDTKRILQVKITGGKEDGRESGSFID